ncbi:MAG: peptidoglycan DD-metalloendopeptidase family protein [Gallionella sp.]|nr:peptidoglycan DD-metalloendopeptidase family protein [Gallionella sp.]
MTLKKLITCTLLAATLVACTPTLQGPADGKGPAMVETTEATRMKEAGEKDWRPATHEVLKGDTLYSIAFYYGLDYHDLADLNGIKDPRQMKVGQILNLFPSAGDSAALESEAPVQLVIKDQPKVVKYVYNEAALAQIDDVQNPSKATPTIIAKVEPVSSSRKPAVVTPAKTSTTTTPREDAPHISPDEDALQWSMPASGKVITQFSEADNRKGIDISGKLGQSIVASAPGKVVYSGSGLRGYGKLIIIKHNKTYLSAYAHNDKVLVKEGQSVKRGEKIAEMGKTDADQFKLHFEVRRLGKPVDPAKYLPKS